MKQRHSEIIGSKICLVEQAVLVQVIARQISALVTSVLMAISPNTLTEREQ